jgi:hypothetical protein
MRKRIDFSEVNELRRVPAPVRGPVDAAKEFDLVSPMPGIQRRTSRIAGAAKS